MYVSKLGKYLFINNIFKIPKERQGYRKRARQRH